MVWAEFGFVGSVSVMFPLAALSYQDLLKDKLLYFAEAIGGPVWKLQQENLSIHTAKGTGK